MPDFLPPKFVGVQQRPLYIRVRSILEILSTLWLISAVIGIGFFSGGTTSLAFSLILLYGTGGALLIVISALYRVLSRAARQRVEAAPDDSAAAVFVDTTRSATEEIMAALRPAAPHGRPGVSVRMPQTVDALDVAAALTARTAAMTSAVAAEKSAASAAAMVTPGKSTGGTSAVKKSAVNKSAVNKSASKKKAAPKQPAQPKKAQAAKSRPANNNGSRGTVSQASTAPKKSTGGKKPGSAGKGSGGEKASNSGSAGTKKPERAAAASEVKAAHFETGMSMPGIRTAQQEILPRQTGAPSCGLSAGAARPGGAGPRQLVAA